MIVVVDHGMGNLGSVQNMLRKIGSDSVRTADPKVIRQADKLILAGIGAFDGAIDRLAELNLIDVLNEQVLGRKVPILGICLGMQLMGRTSEEGRKRGLGWIEADVQRFQFPPDRQLPVPHMGWESLRLQRTNVLLKSGENGSDVRFYFSHAYHVICDNAGDVTATAAYGYEFTAAVERENVYGVQFHPEKSHVFGLDLYRRFVGLGSQ